MADYTSLPLKRILLRSFKVALIVGLILNVINQPQAFMGSEAFNWFQSVLTFCVPFFVSTYGAVSVTKEKIAMSRAQ